MEHEKRIGRFVKYLETGKGPLIGLLPQPSVWEEAPRQGLRLPVSHVGLADWRLHTEQETHFAWTT
jgi:hypothetical protein